VVPLFPRFTALDAIGPYEVLAQVPTFEITFVGHATELLADRIAAQAAQLLIEYDPQPPFDCGARPKAGDEVMARVWEYDATAPDGSS
jgi:hypothetical protein